MSPKQTETLHEIFRQLLAAVQNPSSFTPCVTASSLHQSTLRVLVERKLVVCVDGEVILSPLGMAEIATYALFEIEDARLTTKRLLDSQYPALKRKANDALGSLRILKLQVVAAQSLFSDR